MTIGERIKNAREACKMSQDSLAKALGYRSRSSIAKIEAGVSSISTEQLAHAAELLKVSPLHLLCGADDQSIAPVSTRRLPLLGEIACGIPRFASEEFECFVDAGSNVSADFCLRAKGDSMIGARIFDGDIVFIRSQPDVLDGEIAAVLIGDEATLKRVYKVQGRLQLRAENPAYPPLNYEGEECSQVRILGKAVAFQSSLQAR